MKLNTLLAAAALSAVCAGAQAATIVQNIDVSASQFWLLFGDSAAAPIQPAFIDLTVKYDPSTTFSGATSGLTVHGTNLPYPVQYAYNGNTLTIASNAGAGWCGNPSSSFCIFLSNVQSSAPSVFFQQSTATGGYWIAKNPVAHAAMAAVPEPATWGMMLMGLGGVGLAIRARRRKALAAAAAVQTA